MRTRDALNTKKCLPLVILKTHHNEDFFKTCLTAIKPLALDFFENQQQEVTQVYWI
jgi:hypothetical protein